MVRSRVGCLEADQNICDTRITIEDLVRRFKKSSRLISISAAWSHCKLAISRFIISHVAVVRTFPSTPVATVTLTPWGVSANWKVIPIALWIHWHCAAAP